jgi:hypothetical protein
MLATFDKGLRRFEKLIKSEGLGAIVPNQCEVCYINQMPLEEDETFYQAAARTVRGFEGYFILDDLTSPEDAQVGLRYVIRDEKQEPIGRLTVTLEPARRLDGANILQLSIVARGRPTATTILGVSNFLKLGRRNVVRGFAQLTTAEMQKRWGRSQ